MNSFDIFGNPSDSSYVQDDPLYSAPGFLVPTEEMEESVEEDHPPRQFNGLFLIVAATISLLAGQCFRLQVTQGSVNRSLAEGNSVRILTLPAERGLIVDSQGAVVAQNTRELALAIDPQSLPSKHADRVVVYQQLQKQAGISDQTIAWIEDNRLKTPDIFAIKTNLSKDDSLLYQERFAQTKGVIVQEIPIRQYMNLPSLGHLVGYVSEASADQVKAGYAPGEQVGKSGLETVYNSLLTGTPGKERAEVSASGEIVNAQAKQIISPPKPGTSLKLSLDTNLQRIVATALQHGLDRRQKQYGDLKNLGASAVVIDPATGAIKAMVSLPDYNDQLFAAGISQKDYQKLLDDPASPLLNRAIQGQYPSGSTVKPLIAAAALQAGTIDPNYRVETPAAIYVGNFAFPDWKKHGVTDIRTAIAQSNDIFFYALGGGWADGHIKGLGIDLLDQYLEKFGFGQPLGVDLPGESSGLVPTPSWKEQHLKEPWFIGDTYHSSIGQGYDLMTPLQMASATAVIANGGTLWQPSLAWSTIDPISNKETLLPHKILRDNFISAQNIQIVREGMRQTVTDGSAQPLKTLKVTSAGKTGTAEVIINGKNMTHAWYTGFAPYDNPQLVFAILIEGGGESFYSSVPVAEEILRNYFHDPLAPGQKLNSEPDITPQPGFIGEH